MSKSLKVKFLNPIYDYLSIVILILAMNFFLSVQESVILSCSVTSIMFILSCFFRRQILLWNAIKYFSVLFCYLAMLLLATTVPDKIAPIVPSIIFIIALTIYLVFQQPIKNLLKKRQIAPRFYEEFFHLAKLFLFSLLMYLILFFIFFNRAKGQLVAEDILSILLVTIVVYEFIRETIIKINLNKEEWYPVVDEKGNVIGKVEKKESLFSAKKYLHPIIRVHIIHNNTVYLQKRSLHDIIFPGKWDTAISNHVLFGETIDQCIARTAKVRYGLEDIKPIYFNRYMLETGNEKQLAFVYYIEGTEDLKPLDKKNIQMGKYWTIKQITNELDSGIFTANFVHEFEVLCKKIIYCHNLFEK